MKSSVRKAVLSVNRTLDPASSGLRDLTDHSTCHLRLPHWRERGPPGLVGQEMATPLEEPQGPRLMQAKLEQTLFSNERPTESVANSAFPKPRVPR